MSVHVSRSRLSDHFVPYYYQIANLLRRKIEEGEILPGAKLPGEFELAESFGVSRVPVRHALSLLVTDGMLTRHRGRGTFVTENPPVQSCSKLFGAIGASTPPFSATFWQASGISKAPGTRTTVICLSPTPCRLSVSMAPSSRCSTTKLFQRPTTSV